MKKVFTLIILSVIVFGTYAANNDKSEASEAKIQSPAIQGIVKDAISGELLPGVSVKIEGENKTYYTDFNGKYYISNIKPGEYTITYSYISYETKKQEKIAVKNNELKEMNLSMNIIN